MYESEHELPESSCIKPAVITVMSSNDRPNLPTGSPLCQTPHVYPASGRDVRAEVFSFLLLVPVCCI